MAAAVSPSAIELGLHTAMQRSLLRAFFGAALLLCVLGSLSALCLQPQLAGHARLLVLAGYAVLMALCLAGMRLPPARVGPVLAPTVLGGLALVGLVAGAGGWGLQTPGLLFFGLLVLLVNSVGSARLGLACAGLAVAEVLALGLAERAGWLAAPQGVPPLLARLVMPLTVIVTGALMGRAMAGLLQQHLQAAGKREQRFQALLGIATSAYWETDAALQISQLSQRDASGRFADVPGALGRLPWLMPQWQLDADSMALLRADMARREPGKTARSATFWPAASRASMARAGSSAIGAWRVMSAPSTGRARHCTSPSRATRRCSCASPRR